MAKIRPFIKVDAKDEERLAQFYAVLLYTAGGYDDAASLAALDARMTELEAQHGFSTTNRIFYLALPPSVFKPITALIRAHCWSKVGAPRGGAFARKDGRKESRCANLVLFFCARAGADGVEPADHREAVWQGPGERAGSEPAPRPALHGAGPVPH